MKKIILLIFVSMFAYGQTQTRTSNLQLPQWGTGDTLKAGTKNDPSISNFSLNNGFARVDSVLSASGIDSSGRFSRLYGKQGLNFVIDAGYGEATPRSIVLNDSIIGLYNQQIYGNSLIRGNMYVGGYITTDSIVGGQLTLDSISIRALNATGTINTSGGINAIGNVATDGTLSSILGMTTSESVSIYTNVGGYAPTANSEVKMYVKMPYFIIVSYNGVTFKYRYLDLTSSNATWLYSTTEP
jgi:hypothetical protein